MNKNFKEFFGELTAVQRQELALRAGTTVEYIEHHLLGGRRMPRRRLLQRLVEAVSGLGGSFTEEQLLACFMQAGNERTAAPSGRAT